MMKGKSAIVIGAGIIGLATARSLAVRGWKVKVIERDYRAVGASVRNFGMIWPIGQPDDGLYSMACLSREIWIETCESAGIWYNRAGSLHLAYNQDELTVLKELQEIYEHRSYTMLTPEQTTGRSGAVIKKGLLGSLYSDAELIIDPRRSIALIPKWLNERFGVEFIWGKAVTEINYPQVRAGMDRYEADEIYVCSGADFETLFPYLYAEQPITRCKLQMLKIKSQPDNWRIGPSLCGGLSLLHYTSFKSAPSLEILQNRILHDFPEYLKWGIHVMVSQNQEGELIIGDSHEYGLTPDPFNRSEINGMILSYLKSFATFKEDRVVESWNGIYPKLTNGQTNIVLKPEEGITIINGLGGAGMTLGFGLCEQVVGTGKQSQG